MRAWVEPLGWMLVQSVWLISVIVGGAATETARGDQVEPAQAGDKPAVNIEQAALGTFRGVVAIEGVRPKLPPLNLGDRRPFTIAGLRELPDESLLIGEKGGIANVVVYLLKAPANWTPTPPPVEPLLIESINARFSPRMSILRVGQRLKLKNSMHENINFRSHPVRSQAINMMEPANGEHLVDPKHSQSESLPYGLNCDIFPWMQSWIMALDHPFAAITDTEGRFEIAGLPPGDYEFRVWHESGGGVYLERKLTVRVTAGQATEVSLKYKYEGEGLKGSPLPPLPPLTPEVAALRAERLKANDREAAKKLVGHCRITYPTGSVSGGEFFQTEDGCLKLSGSGLFGGKYAVKGNRVQLVEYGNNNSDNVDIVWEVLNEDSLKLIIHQRFSGVSLLGAVLKRLKPGEEIPKTVRSERGRNNDREAAKKLVGHWKITRPGGFQRGVEFIQAGDGCLRLDKDGIFNGRYAVKGNRVELAGHSDVRRIEGGGFQIEFVWEMQADGSLKLIVDQNNASATNLGAVLERVPADAPKNDAAAQADAKTPAAVDEKVGSGLVPGDFGGMLQVMQIGSDGSISYREGGGLCHMTLFEDDRLKIAFHNDNQIWTDVTLPLVTSPGPQRRTAWSAELDGHTYQVTAIPFSTKGCVFRLEKRLNGKLIHRAQKFFAVKTRASKDKPSEDRDAPAPINLREWRVDQSSTGVIAGKYTGARQVMQIAADGTVTYTDKPHGICHIAVLEDDRLTATFLDKNGKPTEVTLPLATTAAQRRASWSAEIDGHTLRATAIPYSSNVYIFRLEKLLNGKLIEGSQEFYGIEQKLRKATSGEPAKTAIAPANDSD